MLTRYSNMYISQNDQKAQTPDWILSWVKCNFGKYFDPCPPNPKFDGLSIKWKKVNFVNPPFDNISAWMNKAASEAEKGNLIIILVPFRPHTQYTRRNIKYIRKCLVFNSEISFKNYSNPLPHCMCVYIISKKRKFESIPGIKYRCKGYLSTEKLENQFINKFKSSNHFNLTGEVSSPLEKILQNNKNREFSFYCPARFSNKLIYKSFLACCFTVFADISKYIGGSCIITTNTKSQIKLPYLRLYTFDVNYLMSLYKS